MNAHSFAFFPCHNRISFNADAGFDIGFCNILGRDLRSFLQTPWE